jgi:GNAT superfamily N-acetyltransferase
VVNELVKRWCAGWTKADGLVGQEGPGWLEIRVDRPGRRVERVVTDESTVTGLAALTGLDDWLTVPTNSPEAVTKALQDAGLTVRAPETFMRRALADHPAPQPPDGYSVVVTRENVIEVRLLHNGAPAASGLMAVVGEDAVPHRIQTSPEHRRRGLGSVVMGVLAQEAVADGTTTGLLFASDDGLHLYRRLGWEEVADVVIARRD